MIAAVGCLLMALACQDVDRVAGPTKANVAASPPVLLSLTCTLERSSTAISCKPATPSAPAGVSASVIHGASGSYAMFYPYNLVKDTVAHTWAFTAYVQNLLQQSIGTLDGTGVTGVKVIVTDFHATAGSGAVSVANADGTGTFTAPNQQYFTYSQIVAPNGYTGTKLWKFNVPNTVTAVSMSIVISSDFPAEQTVFTVPPDTEPSWFSADSNWNGAQMKRVISMAFKSGTTLADRQLAVAYVDGTIVGGVRGDNGEGGYLLSIVNDGSASALTTAMHRLSSLPQVDFAVEAARGRPGTVHRSRKTTPSTVEQPPRPQ